MAERWQGMGTKEAAGYKEKIDTAWDDIYMGDKGSSSSRSAFRKFLKVAGGLGIANLYGSRQVEKYGNDALARANDIRLDLQQQELMLQNDLRAAAIVGNREKAMQEAGYDYTDPAQIMDFIVNDPDTGLKTDEIEAWKEQYGDKGIGLATDAYNWEDGSTAREIFNNRVASKAVKIFNQHAKIAAHYKGLRGPGNVMPYETEGKVIKDQGYLNNVRAAITNIDTITQGIKKNVEGMKWTDGILYKLGIKKLDRDFIIKEQIAAEVNKKTGAEVKKILKFNLKQTDADENLETQLLLRIQEGIDTDIKDLTIAEALKVLGHLDKAGGTQNQKASEEYIEKIAKETVKNTLTKGDTTVDMASLIETLPTSLLTSAKMNSLSDIFNTKGMAEFNAYWSELTEKERIVGDAFDRIYTEVGKNKDNLQVNVDEADIQNLRYKTLESLMENTLLQGYDVRKPDQLEKLAIAIWNNYQSVNLLEELVGDRAMSRDEFVTTVLEGVATLPNIPSSKTNLPNPPTP
tara:strand:- start:5393 stop:6946 length:1554 start_codon:yes stop_codon:yes gene_type:complete